MKRWVKHVIVVAAGAILLSGFIGQTAQATLVESGTAIMADGNGSTAAPEALVVSYSVDDTAGIYTYSYNVSNPALDQILAGPNEGRSEEFSVFSVTFNTTPLGAILGAASGGAYDPIASGGVEWNFYPAIYAGSSSGYLTFQSDFAPEFGDAGAQDSNLPSPWTGVVPVPATPDSTNTMFLLGGMMLFLPFLKKKANLTK